MKREGIFCVLLVNLMLAASMQWNETSNYTISDQLKWNDTINYNRNHSVNWNNTTNFDKNNQTVLNDTTIYSNPSNRNFCEFDTDCYGNAFCNQDQQQCQCPMGWRAIPDSLRTTGKLLCIQSPCFSDIECLINYGPNTRCGNIGGGEELCICDPQYKLDWSTQSCVKSENHEQIVSWVPCFNNYACNINNQFCNNERKCQCKFGQVLNEQNNHECVLLSCENNEQCSNLYGRGATCSFGTCSCGQSYHLNTTTQSCQLDKNIYCTFDMDCPSELTCMDNNKCGCKFGTIFNAQDNTCQKSNCILDEDCSNFGDDTYCVLGQCYCYHSSSVRMQTCNSKFWQFGFGNTWSSSLTLSLIIGLPVFAALVLYTVALRRIRQKQEESRRMNRRRQTNDNNNAQMYNTPPPAYKE